MSKVFITSGMSYGDEGKGTFVDYLAHLHVLSSTVRYGGGAQARHTVVAPNGLKHSFSQLGSGMMLQDSQTYLTANMVVNPMSLVVEALEFANKLGLSAIDVISRVTIAGDCPVVTPYHRTLCHLREFAGPGYRRGRVGTGTSDVRPLLREASLGLTMNDLMSGDFGRQIVELRNYATNFYREHESSISQFCPTDMQNDLRSVLGSLCAVDEVIDHYRRLTCDYDFNVTNDPVLQETCQSGAVFETSQGLLLDEVYGTTPHVTQVDTTNVYGVQLAQNLTDAEVYKVGIVKALASRHGMGAFPTEDTQVASMVIDDNQQESFFMGSVRWGWFDALLIRYAQMVNHADTLYVSCLDQLDGFENIKICDAYIYDGKVDDEFRAVFEFEYQGPKCIVHNIIGPSNNLSRYLSQCRPIYMTVKGWMVSTRNVMSGAELPQRSLDYLELITKLTGIKVSVVSVGPTREQKVAIS